MKKYSTIISHNGFPAVSRDFFHSLSYRQDDGKVSVDNFMFFHETYKLSFTKINKRESVNYNDDECIIIIIFLNIVVEFLKVLR